MARSVTDAATILSLITGHDSSDNYTLASPSPSLNYTKALDASAIRGKRFGVPRAVFTNDSLTGNDPYVNIVFNQALKTIQAMGGVVVDPADLPSAMDIVTSNNENLVLDVDFKVCALFRIREIVQNV